MSHREYICLLTAKGKSSRFPTSCFDDFPWFSRKHEHLHGRWTLCTWVSITSTTISTVFFSLLGCCRMMRYSNHTVNVKWLDKMSKFVDIFFIHEAKPWTETKHALTSLCWVWLIPQGDKCRMMGRRAQIKACAPSQWLTLICLFWLHLHSEIPTSTVVEIMALPSRGDSDPCSLISIELGCSAEEGRYYSGLSLKVYWFLWSVLNVCPGKHRGVKGRGRIVETASWDLSVRLTITAGHQTNTWKFIWVTGQTPTTWTIIFDLGVWEINTQNQQWFCEDNCK